MTKKVKHILIAEDEEAYSRVLKYKLEDEGFTVSTAADGAEALKAVQNKKQDLLLLDLIMPVMNGFEVLEKWSKDAVLKKIPVIVLSNLGQEEDIKRTTALGAKDYFIKTDMELVKVVEKVRGVLV